MADLPFSCTCGKLSGHLLEASPRTGTHCACHCADCRRTARYFGIEATPEDGVELFQTSADRIRIDEGAEHLALLRLSPKGLFRWYAACCNTPLFNTSTKMKFPFASVLTHSLDSTEPLGPITGRIFMPGPGGKTRHENMGRMVFGMMTRTLGSAISGRWRQTPFFNLDTGDPVVPPIIAPKDAGRDALGTGP